MNIEGSGDKMAVSLGRMAIIGSAGFAYNNVDNRQSRAV
jgi:hypothetical protein